MICFYLQIYLDQWCIYGVSNGLVPMLRVFNATARYVDQGGNKRPGAFAIYLEPWHADIFEFLELRKNTGKEEQVGRLAGSLERYC